VIEAAKAALMVQATRPVSNLGDTLGCEKASDAPRQQAEPVCA
jgi:hypothetical protein